MRYEIKGVASSAVVDDTGIHITSKKESHSVVFDKLVSVSVRAPGLLTTGHIFFRTVADSSNPLASLNTIMFKGKDTYELACKIKEAVEAAMQEKGA